MVGRVYHDERIVAIFRRPCPGTFQNLIDIDLPQMPQPQWTHAAQVSNGRRLAFDGIHRRDAKKMPPEWQTRSVAAGEFEHEVARSKARRPTDAGSQGCTGISVILGARPVTQIRPGQKALSRVQQRHRNRQLSGRVPPGLPHELLASR